jgi:hypothetical protein
MHILSLEVIDLYLSIVIWINFFADSDLAKSFEFGFAPHVSWKLYGRGSRFLDFQFPTPEFGLAKEFEVEKAFFFIFMSSYAEISF